MIIDIDVEDWPTSPVFRARAHDYRRWRARAYADRPAKLTPRQAVFYTNLIRLALALQSRELPVDFELPSGERLYLDHGCIKIAEHAGFIEVLEDNAATGTVDTIRLVWRP